MVTISYKSILSSSYENDSDKRLNQETNVDTMSWVSGFSCSKKKISSVLHLNLDLNNTSALLQFILGKEAFRANLNWSSCSDFRADKQFLTPAEGMVHVGYLELQTEICRAVSTLCKECFLHFLLSVLLWMNHRRIKPKSTFVLLEERLALVVTYFNGVFSFLYFWMVSIGFT